jgi:cell fate regulator YaaT (PSP1 superfamily)
MDPFIVGVRFQKVGKIYHFDASGFQDLEIGDFVIVETSRGRELGEIISIVSDHESQKAGKWKPIHQKATPRDLVRRQFWQKKEIEALILCREKASELKIDGIKIVSAEYSFDGGRISFHYNKSSDTKVDLKRLRKTLKQAFPRIKVELRQIGPRDVAKKIGGFGACGLEKRCCSLFLSEFSPISIRMAKAQGVSLSPSEITGMCGRLRCCLIYEYQQYVQAKKNLPKLKKRVITPLGEGKVVDIIPLSEEVLVELEAGSQHKFLNQDIHPLNEYKELQQKINEPCKNDGNGSTNCKNQSNKDKA